MKLIEHIDESMLSNMLDSVFKDGMRRGVEELAAEKNGFMTMIHQDDDLEGSVLFIEHMGTEENEYIPLAGLIISEVEIGRDNAKDGFSPIEREIERVELIISDLQKSINYAEESLEDLLTAEKEEG